MALSEVFWQLLLIHTSHAQAHGDVAAAVAGTVETVPGAADPLQLLWPGSCVKVSTIAAALIPDERTYKAIADVSAAAAVAAVVADEDAALTWSGHKTVLLCSQASCFISLLSLSGRFLLFF